MPVSISNSTTPTAYKSTLGPTLPVITSERHIVRRPYELPRLRDARRVLGHRNPEVDDLYLVVIAAALLEQDVLRLHVAVVIPRWCASPRAARVWRKMCAMRVGA